MAQVILKNLCKSYDGKVNTVKQVNLTIRDHEFMVLVGPSGCGKSTTLRMIAGLEEITSGECFIGDRLVNSIPPRERDIAMVFQNYALYPHMTVYQNMAFGLQLRHIAAAEIERRVLEAAGILGIEGYLKRLPKELSGGQRQRVAVGRAIVRNPAVFLFDEPLSNLDAKMRVQMRSEIGELHRRLQATMVYVTHDQIEAMTMGDRICVMLDGVVQQVDTPLNIYDRPANVFVAGFIGTPPTHFFDGCLAEEGRQLYFDCAAFRLRLPEAWRESLSGREMESLILGIRPEHFETDLSGVPPDQRLHARVRRIELMGAESFLHLEFGEGRLAVAKVSAHCPAAVGDTIELGVCMEKVHLFSQETEERIL